MFTHQARIVQEVTIPAQTEVSVEAVEPSVSVKPVDPSVSVSVSEPEPYVFNTQNSYIIY